MSSQVGPSLARQTVSRNMGLMGAVFCTLSFFSTSQSALASDDVGAAPQMALQGVWQGMGPGGPCTVTIAGSRLSYWQRDDFWFETEFSLPAAEGPPQLHAEIVDQSPGMRDLRGTVVVTIFRVDAGSLDLGVVEDFPEPPSEPLVGDWDWVADLYELERKTGS